MRLLAKTSRQPLINLRTKRHADNLFVRRNVILDWPSSQSIRCTDADIARGGVSNEDEIVRAIVSTT